MLRKIISLILFLILFSITAFAQEIIIIKIPDAQKVGEGRLSLLFFDVYDATLYAPKKQWSISQPFALSIHYFVDIKGKDIADHSVKEMRDQGMNDAALLDLWHREMTDIFPNVKNGTVLTAIFIPGSHTEFFENNSSLGTIKGDDFLRWFSGIWLSEKTSEPSLRIKLLGNL